MTARSASEMIVAVDGLGKTYRSGNATLTAVRAVTFALARGEFVALTGPSGCGKSTLLNMLACVEVPSEGEISIAGRRTSTLGDSELTLLRRTYIGYVFQFFNLMPMLDVSENVALPLLLSGTAPGEVRSAVSAALAAVGLQAQAGQRPGTLSGGEQQRAAIARAIVHMPPLLLADEPTGNLDTKTGEQILHLLQRVCAERKLTLLVATHNAEVAAVADRVLVMRDGALVV